MAAVVADASPLIALHQIDHLELLERLFAQVEIPPAVAREAAPSLPVLPSWILVRQLSQPIDSLVLRAALGRGEAEALALAQQTRAELVIIDDRPARRLALNLGLSVAGTAGILARAKRAGFILAVRPLIEQLLRLGFRISPAIIEQVLADADEQS
jgi:predicted nucleic acid-binding protein